MCDCYRRCKCFGIRIKFRKPLTLLLLDSWQREYDKRPYRNFRFSRLDMEERLERNYHEIHDFTTIVEFMQKRSLCSAKFTGFRIVAYPPDLLENFVITLQRLTSVEFKLMNLPNMFFRLLLQNVQFLHLKELSFEGTELRRKVIPLLQEFLYKSSSLMSLNVNSCSILQYDFALLADGIYHTAKLQKFHCNRLLGGHLTLDTEKIVQILSEILWQNQLTELELQQNEFIARDMQVLAEYMRSRLCRLRKLNVAYNIIGPDGAKYLLRSISASSSLRHLNMAGNGLGTHGGEHVAHYLSTCATLEYLNIMYNNIGVEGINQLLTAMKKPIMLQRLEIYGNYFDSYSAMVLKRLIDARVVPQSSIDITYTPDETGEAFRVIPYRD